MTQPLSAAQKRFADIAHDRAAILRVDNLACHRGARSIFADLSFDVKAGQALMVVGANGSGKSSLLRQLAGLLPLAAGRIDTPQAPMQAAHYLGHADGLKPALSIGETLAFEAGLAAQPINSADFDVAKLGGFLGLPKADWQFVGDLSAGQKRRLTLARLLLDPRPLWLLDEPLTALDMAGRALVTQLAQAHLAIGGMIIAASHEALPFATRTLSLESKR